MSRMVECNGGEDWDGLDSGGKGKASTAPAMLRAGLDFHTGTCRLT